ncbi:putative cytochrome P450 2U1 [Apostichopus japonicus]|uniref:Putative cytochrome P450 2U1 n=1 Tax=Stichopus japonicus TaxID=307972 RepID=A0A2G8KPF3_STIJA|nr:putative cytochrome P450 2U1 [Apostichopus japonicus]
MKNPPYYDPAGYLSRNLPIAKPHCFKCHRLYPLSHSTEWTSLERTTKVHYASSAKLRRREEESGIQDQRRGTLSDGRHDRNRGPFDPSEYTTMIIANVICNINFGKRFDYKDKHFQDIINQFRFLIASVSLTGLPNSFPFLLRTPLYSYIGRSFDYMKAYIGGHLKEHQQTLNEDDVRDYIDMYLLEIKRQQESGEEVIFKPEQAWRAIMEIFGGGTDTTTNTLLYGILLTSLHTEVQDKVSEVKPILAFEVMVIACVASSNMDGVVNGHINGAE